MAKGKTKLKKNPKKSSLKITSKTKKKLKTTQKKLNFDFEKLNKITSHLIKASINEEDNNIELNSIFLYITFKKNFSEDEIKNIKNKLIKIKHPMIDINNKNSIHLCLIEDDLKENENIELNSLTKSKIEIFKKEEFKSLIKEVNNDYSIIDNNYQIIIANQKNISCFNNFCDVLSYQKKNYDFIKNSLNKIIDGATIIKMVNKRNNMIKIKVGHTCMKKEEINDNAYRVALKTVALALTDSEKHNGVENIVIKTGNSIPFVLFGNIKAEDVPNYK